MRRRAAALLASSSVLLLIMLIGGQTMVSAGAQPIVTSGWLTQPVILDGRITTNEEWSDAAPADLIIPNRAGQSVSTRIWIKNDLNWLFILASVKWPLKDIDWKDAFWFYVYSGPTGPGTVYDESEVWFDGTTKDQYGQAPPWVTYEDTMMSPPGENNVRGAASHNGTHYWFELGRPLNAGDRYDLALAPGEAHANIYVGFHDIGKPTADERCYDLGISLVLAPIRPSIDLTKPDDLTTTCAFPIRFVASVSGHLSKVTLVVDGEDHEMKLNQAGLHEVSLTLAEGAYKWRVKALGVLGNVTSTPERSLTVDTTKPVLTIRSPTSGEVINRNEVYVVWDASDAASGIAKVEVSADASDWVDVTGRTSCTATFVVEGNHEVRVRAIDKAGNVAEQITTFTWLPPPWYVSYWYVLVALAAIVVAIVAIARFRTTTGRKRRVKIVSMLILGIFIASSAA